MCDCITKCSTIFPVAIGIVSIIGYPSRILSIVFQIYIHFRAGQGSNQNRHHLITNIDVEYKPISKTVSGEIAEGALSGLRHSDSRVSCTNNTY